MPLSIFAMLACTFVSVDQDFYKQQRVSGIIIGSLRKMAEINLQAVEYIRDFLIKQHETLAVAESVTTGLLQTAFGSVHKASKFYQGGITTYNIGQKYRHLLIDPIYCLECNCISQKVANAMALNVCKLFSSNWGAAITGYATPTIEVDNKLFAFYAVAHDNKVLLEKEITPVNDVPSNIQSGYVNEVLMGIQSLMK